MAILRRADGSGYVAPAAHCLVGRSPTCTLRVDHPLVSREHGRLEHAGGSWFLRDLGSSNGTFVNGERLAWGAPRALRCGDLLGFGSAETTFELDDDSPPVAMARRLDADLTLAAEGGVLALPSPDAPLASVLEQDGAFVVEIDGQARAARDGEVLTLQGAAFMLHLPVGSAATVSPSAEELRRGLAEVELRFRVSRDEEQVEVTVAGPAGAHVLPPRAYHYTWLTIARARVRDRAARSLVEAQRGWINVDDLLRSLRLDEAHLNVEIHRIRQGMAALGVPDGAGVIERRRGARQLRLGVERVVIDPG
ncbi:MAG: FHA domain-containing protein [Byssovorax sp.]